MNETKAAVLDWRRWYADHSLWPIDTNIFLADAVTRVGPMLVQPWLDDLPIESMADPAPRIPSPFEAFDEQGFPASAMHDRWASEVLAFMPSSELSRRRQSNDPAAWLSSRYRLDEGNGKVSLEHWTEACAAAANVNDLRRAGIAAMAHIGRAIATMALHGDITISARPLGGGSEPARLEPGDWLIDDPLPRLATCAINIDDRMNVEAEPTHLLFVDGEGFEAAAWVHARRHAISLHDEGLTPIDVGFVGPRPAKAWKALEDNVHRIMREHLLAEPTEYHRSALKFVVEGQLGTIGSTIFERARQRCRDEFPFMKEGGAPRGTVRRPTTGGGNVFQLPSRR